jgi:hypothetical protein
VGDSGFGPMTAVNLGDLKGDGTVGLLVRDPNAYLLMYTHTGNVGQPYGGGIQVWQGFAVMTDLN